MLYIHRMLPARIVMHSLVGVGPQRPAAYGNYCRIAHPEHKHGIPIVNMWVENLTSAAERFLPDGQVRVREYSWIDVSGQPRLAGLIDDERIPLDWYYQKLIWSSAGKPPLEIAADMYALHGDPTNELEQWIDERMYWQRRGGTLSADGLTLIFANPNSQAAAVRFDREYRVETLPLRVDVAVDSVDKLNNLYIRQLAP